MSDDHLTSAERAASVTGQGDVPGEGGTPSPASEPVAEPEPVEQEAVEPVAVEPGAGESVAGEPEGISAEEDGVSPLEEAHVRTAALTEDLQRLQAEYLNYKRRVERDRELVRENATFSVLSALLPVLDDIDRARQHGELEGGFKAVAEALERSVAAQGFTKFGEPGDAFDPRLHEALMHSHSPDVTTTSCRDIVTAGYRIGERVVRPAKVTVVDPEPA